jgi:SPP1 family predicted phage head-tail adaptor
MYFSDLITLRIETYPTGDAVGFPVPVVVDTPCWANKASVTRSEFYAASANGIEATQSYEVHSEDWNGQNFVIDGAQEYRIIRAYQKGLGIVVLTCTDKGA